MVNALLYVYYPEPEDYQMIIWGAIAFAVVLVFHLMWRYRASSLGHYRQKHLQIPAMIWFGITAGGGLAMRIIGNDNYGLYTPLHSSFHVLGALAEYFFFRIHDPDGLVTFATMDPCSADYDVAATEDGDEFDKQCVDEVSLATLTG